MAKIKFDLYWDEESNSWEAINSETGEIKSFSPVKKSTKKSVSKVDIDTTPKLTLETSKYILTQAAADLLGVQPDDRIDIKYEKQGKRMVPIIGSNEAFGTKAGNKLTKSLTVSCRGKANEELSQYGTIFTITAHPIKEGLFILNGDKIIPEQQVDDAVEIKEDQSDVDLDSELDDLLAEDSTDNITEITNFDFNI